MSAPSEPLPDQMIPRHVLMKVLNRRRRLLWWQRNGAPPDIVAREQKLLDKALDDFCAWAEEHAPDLFYRDKEDVQWNEPE
jgi:hypothetical protein